jgi:hypothetical protein
MDALSRASFVEPTSRDGGVTAAYGAGYFDGITLLHGDGHNGFPVEPLRSTHARYLSYAGLDDPTPGERAYIDGFRDVASDNLFCPPHESESQPRSVTA